MAFREWAQAFGSGFDPSATPPGSLSGFYGVSDSVDSRDIVSTYTGVIVDETAKVVYEPFSGSTYSFTDCLYSYSDYMAAVIVGVIKAVRR